MFKKILLWICLPLALLGAVCMSSGCGKSQEAAPKESGKMKVVATTTMLTDLSKQIGGDKVEVSGLMKAGVDPHLYQASAGDVDAMNKADIVVYNGVHLEGKMGAIFDNLAKNKKPMIRVSDGLDKSTLLDFEEDGEKTKDPHIWFSVNNWKKAAGEVCKGFSAKDPHKTIESLQAAVKANGFDVSIGGELYSDSLGDESTKEGTYIGMYEHNIKTITGALR